MGLAPSEIRRMTLREINHYAAGFNVRRFEDYREAVAIAHLTAALHRSQKFPKLRDILPKTPSHLRPKQTDAERRAMLIRHFNTWLPPEQRVLVDSEGKVLN